MTSTAPPRTVIQRARALEAGDKVRVARSGYEWASPLDVQDVAVTEWLGRDGGWSTAALELATTHGTLGVLAVEDDTAVIKASGQRHTIVRFDPVDDPADSFPCEHCGKEFDSERGRNIHIGQTHDTGDELSDDIDEELGIQDRPGADGGVADTGDGEADAMQGDVDASSEAADESLDRVDDGDEPQRVTPEERRVKDLDDVPPFRYRSMRQKVRAAPDDASDEDLAQKIGATPSVVRQLRGEIEAIEERHQAETDGGAVTATTATSRDGFETTVDSTGQTCQNCGRHVSRDYTRVYAPDEDEGPRCCPFCPDMIRENDGTVREARSTRSDARGVDQ